MPAYIGLYKLTDQGIKDIKNAPARVEEAIKGVQAMGGKVLGRCSFFLFWIALPRKLRGS
jgi:uncharacterized protein with GYD domain